MSQMKHKWNKFSMTNRKNWFKFQEKKFLLRHEYQPGIECYYTEKNYWIDEAAAATRTWDEAAAATRTWDEAAAATFTWEEAPADTRNWDEAAAATRTWDEAPAATRRGWGVLRTAASSTHGTHPAAWCRGVCHGTSCLSWHNKHNAYILSAIPAIM
jgi:hypothetical protein